MDFNQPARKQVSSPSTIAMQSIVAPCSLLSRAEAQGSNISTATFCFLKLAPTHQNREEKSLIVKVNQKEKKTYYPSLATVPKF